MYACCLLAAGLLVGCGPAVPRDELGEVIFEIPRVPGADKPYPLPTQDRSRSAEDDEPDEATSGNANSDDVMSDSVEPDDVEPDSVETNEATTGETEPAGDEPDAVNQDSDSPATESDASPPGDE
jgi:hypothetical protein